MAVEMQVQVEMGCVTKVKKESRKMLHTMDSTSNEIPSL